MPGESQCSPKQVQNCLGRISGPLLDRIDLHVGVPAVKFQEIASGQPDESSAAREYRLPRRRVLLTRFACALNDGSDPFQL